MFTVMMGTYRGKGDGQLVHCHVAGWAPIGERVMFTVMMGTYRGKGDGQLVHCHDGHL